MGQETEEYGVLLFSMVATILIIAFFMNRSSHRKQQMKRKLSEAKKTQAVPKGIIIIAVEIVNFIVFFSEKHKPQYKSLSSSQNNFASRVMNYLANIRPCFFQRFNRKAIRKFFRELKMIENIKLVLYTSLEREECVKILKDLSIDNCFDQNERIFTSAEYKVAEDVDPDTGRVIILSANKEDLDRSVTSHHSLILDLGRNQRLLQERLLNNLKDCFAELANRGRVDTLHEDMHMLSHEKGLPIFNDDSN